jgi:uncharacterized repeat protein (TIGR01451 family)
MTLWTRISGLAVTASMLIVAFAPRPAFAQLSFDAQHCPPVQVCTGALVVPGCSCLSNTEVVTKCAPHTKENGQVEAWCTEIIKGPPPLTPPPGCDPADINKKLQSATGTIEFVFAPKNCQITAAHCEALPGRHLQELADGTKVCAPNACSKQCSDFGGIEFCSKCIFLPIDPRKSVDPNDKIGKLGASAAQFVRGDTPLSYTIHFENLSTATAPAQIVVVTDQLDPQRVDLESFRLGPIALGDNTLPIAPGLKGFTGGMDFRPAQNLIVSIVATLDKTTGLVTWRFTSIDPDTGELTDNPDAGFLPPNTAPPAGEGSVVFTVMPKSGLATGTAIRNQATIVFDTNAPIPTPTWLNTIDRDAPATHMLPLARTQSAPTFVVAWTGSDAGSGISSYTVFVSDNGGPFSVWLEGSQSSAAYSGQTGHTYGFFSIGADQAGNVEALKTAAETTTQVVSSTSCASNVSSQVQITRSGYGYNFATQRFVQTVTLKNMTTAVITGRISLVLDGLSITATLFGPAGSTACALPAGSPYINFTGNLNPGASASTVLQFANPTRAGISYATRVLAGSAAR